MAFHLISALVLFNILLMSAAWSEGAGGQPSVGCEPVERK